MRSLARAARAKGEAGEPIPQPIAAIRQLGFVMRRGQLSLWVAAPGVGKSIVALQLALGAGVPTLYVSADTDRTDQAERVTQSGVDLADLPLFLRFEFDTGPTANDVAQMCEAYGLVFGEYPHLIIVDTLSKVWSDAGDENGRNKEAVDRMQEVARVTGAHVMVCHHATKGYDSGDKPIPLDGLMSGVSKQPEQVMSMWRDGADRVCFSPVKNRSGRADPTTNTLRSWARIDFNLMQVTDLQIPAGYRWQDDPELAET